MSASLAASPRRASRGGFTLLEVLMALTIFLMASIVLATAYVGILNSYDAASKGGMVDADVEFARSLALNEPDREKLEEGGEFEGADGRRVRWSVEITSTTTAELFKVDFTCEFTGGPPGQEPEKIVESFTVLRPTWVIDTAERDKLREEAKTRIMEIQDRQEEESVR